MALMTTNVFCGSLSSVRAACSADVTVQPQKHAVPTGLKSRAGTLFLLHTCRSYGAKTFVVIYARQYYCIDQLVFRSRQPLSLRGVFDEAISWSAALLL